MCGIAGIFNFNNQPVDIATLQRMTDAQRHRGPDDQGIRLFSLCRQQSVEVKPGDTSTSNEHLEGGVGFNRLSILDLSANGHQPMCNSTGRICITINGEIYNAFDYKAELESAGFRFRGSSDTEVALYLYEHYGLNGMLERLNGMFAICIFDLNSQEIFLARDRLGIKPLYIYQTDELILFSSEVKSFLSHQSFAAELDTDRFDEFMMFRYASGNGSLLRGVRQLEPGHWMRIRPDGCKEERYWDIPQRTNSTARSLNREVDELESRVKRSVSMQLLSDVKVGCQLSGGIDSSLISVLASQYAPKSMDSFSVIFDDAGISEEPWIDEAAKVAGMPTHKFEFTPDYFYKNLTKATWHLDQPLNHPNSLGIMLLAEHARSHITVFLSGEGADELFGGYTRFLYAHMRPRIQKLVRFLPLIPHLGSRLSQRYLVKRHLDHIDWFILQSAHQTPQLLGQVRPGANVEDAFERRRALFDDSGTDYIDNCTKYEMRTYLVDLLIRQDKMTMAHSMENRVPFLDHELVEYVRNLPSDFLVRHSNLLNFRMGNTKVLLKRLARKHFDQRFVYRMKSGFPLPLRSYFSDPRFKPLMEDLILPGVRKRGLLDGAKIESWWRNIETVGEDIVEALWITMAFEVWAQQFLDGNWSCHEY